MVLRVEIPVLAPVEVALAQESKLAQVRVELAYEGLSLVNLLDYKDL